MSDPPVPRRALIIGAGETGRGLRRELEEHFPAAYEVVGYVDNEVASGLGDDVPVLGSREELPQLVRRYRIDEVMIADFLVGRLGGAVGSIDRESGGAMSLGSPASQAERRDDYPLVGARVHRPGAAKRVFDVLFSLTALVIGAPAVALAALAIKLTSPGPVLYGQERVGWDGQIFTIYKLRTMVQDAEQATGPTLARRDDPRSTRVGRILRTTKLDEWPQFFNVLRGDMSVVGPRPERLYFVQAYSRHVRNYSARHSVRPGITGLAQVKGGYLTHVYVKLRYDLVYIHHYSFWLDLLILAQTPLSILRSMRDVVRLRL